MRRDKYQKKRDYRDAKKESFLNRLFRYVATRSGAWKRSVSFLACVVVFITTYVLILPAVTLEKEKTDAVGMYMEEISPAETAELLAARASAYEAGDMDFSVSEEYVLSADDFAEIPESLFSDGKKDAQTTDAGTGNDPKEDGELFYKGGDYAVTVDYAADAEIPADALLAVRELLPGTMEYNQYLMSAKLAMGLDAAAVLSVEQARFFDITILTADGENELEPKAAVTVQITYDEPLTVPDTDQMNAIHFPYDAAAPELLEVQEIQTRTNDDTAVTAVTFDADSFSVYGILYTVDFEYEIDGQTYFYHLTGGSEMLLSELFGALCINRDLAQVIEVTFTDPSLLDIVRVGEDWKLVSLAPFDTEECLTVTFESGDVIVFRVTDDQEAEDQEMATWASPYDLAGNAKSWVRNAELLVESTNGQMVAPESNMKIPEYAKFSIKIPFEAPASGNSVGFYGLKPGDKIVYTIPAWVRKLDVESGSLTVGGKNAGEWKNENNQIVITLNDTFITDNPFGLSGSIELSGSMEATTTTETETVKVIDFLDSTVNTVVRKRTGGVLNIDIQKVFKGETNGTSGTNCGECSSAKYELTVFAGDLTGQSQRNNSDLEEIVIDDFFTVKEKYAFMNEAAFNQNNDLKKYITYTNISAKIYDHKGAEVTDRKVIVVDTDATDAKAQFKVMNADGTTSSVLHPDEKVIITYDAEISKEMYEHDPRGPWHEASDQEDKFGWNTKVNEKDGSSGSSKNTSPIQGATNQNRSWVERQAENGAMVTTRSLSEPKQATTKNADGSNKDPLNFNKTWLWKNGDPRTNYTSNYEVSVNEDPIMNIIGWTFRDPIGNAQNGQTIISDVKVTRNGAYYETISLVDLQQSGGVSSGNAKGSTTDEIVYVFPDNANYRFFYTARYKNPSGENEIKCENSATLTESGDDGDAYGVYESHTVKGATVTKRLDYMDVGEGVIRWQTTIDEGIGVVDGSVYKDFLGWIRKPKDGSNVESTLNSTDNDHTVDLNKLNLEITCGEGNGMVTIPVSDYSVVAMSTDEIKTSRLVNDQANGVETWNVPYGFKITFNKSYPGPILLHYSTVADFQNVAWEEEFINKFTFQKEPAHTTEQPNGSYIFHDSVGATYQQHSTLNKVAESISDADVPVIKWHLSINTQKYNASRLKVVDKIPEGLEFDLLRDLQVRWVENGDGASASTLDDWKGAYTGDRNAPYDSWPTKTANNADNNYFTATFDSNTRKLEIVLKDIAFKKVEFNVYTQPMLSQLMVGQSHEYENTAEVWTASETQENVKLQSASAKSSISYTFAGKDVVYNAETAPNAEYRIEVNKGGIDLNPKGDRFIVTDEAVEGSTLRFKVPETLVVRKKDGTQLTLNEDPYSEIRSNEVRLTAIGDSSFSLDVPDNTSLVIEYKAFVPGVVGENANLSNSVTLTAENEQIFTRTLTENKAVQKSKVTVDAANRIQIRKGSTGENAVLLDGAEFAIYDVTENNNNGYSIENLNPVGTLTTGVKKADGSYAVGFGLASTYLPTQISLENFKIYKIVETKAPEGYKTPVGENAVAGMFVFVTEEPPEGTTTEAYIEQIQKYRTAGIQVINKNYTDFAFYKSNEPDLTSVSVTKQWLDKKGNARANYAEDEETVTFALMRHVDGQDDTQVGETREIKFENSTWQTVTIGELPKVENGKAITYYVKELTPDPARDNLKVTYRLGENGAEQSDPTLAKTYADADSSTIIIINRDISVDIQLVKIDETTRSSENKRYLKGAEFTLYRRQKTSAEGKTDYVVYSNETASVKTSNDEGKLTFTGLPDGKYRISETQVPAGYVKYEKEDIFFTIDGGEVHWTDKDGSAITSQSLVSYDSTDKTFTIGNQPGVELPSTGGPGKWPYTVCGSLLLLLAAVFYKMKLYKNHLLLLQHTA